jgi:hypothetical protein
MRNIEYETDAPFVQQCYVEKESEDIVLAFLETEKCYPMIQNIVFGKTPELLIHELDESELYSIVFTGLEGYEIWATNEWKEGICITFVRSKACVQTQT